MKKLISLQTPYIILSVPSVINPQPLIEVLQKYNCPFLLTTFTNFNFDLIPYIVTVKELIKTHNYEIKNILNLSTLRDNSGYLQKAISEFQPGLYPEKHVQKIDKFCLSFIDQVLSMNGNMMWNPDCVYYETTEYLIQLFDSFPITDTFMKSMRIPNYYMLPISPRCSPKHSLERLIGYIKPKMRTRNTYYTVICEINDEEDLEKVAKNISHFVHGDICVLNKGSMKRISHKQLPYDYYYPVEDNGGSDKNLMAYSLSSIELGNYTNFVFCDDSFEIVENINEFLERSIYKNTCFSQKNGEYDTSLFSLVVDNIVDFANQTKEEKFDFQEYFKKCNAKFLWISKIEENDEETIIEYLKTGLDNGEDYPLV